MTKADLIHEVHGALGGSLTKKDTAAAIQAVFDNLSDAIRVFGFLFLGNPPPVLGVNCVPIPGCPEACP